MEKDYLFYDPETGEQFFVECESESDAFEILLENEFDPDTLVLCGVYDPEDADILGYDTY